MHETVCSNFSSLWTMGILLEKSSSFKSFSPDVSFRIPKAEKEIKISSNFPFSWCLHAVYKATGHFSKEDSSAIWPLMFFRANISKNTHRIEMNQMNQMIKIDFFNTLRTARGPALRFPTNSKFGDMN